METLSKLLKGVNAREIVFLTRYKYIHNGIGISN